MVSADQDEETCALQEAPPDFQWHNFPLARHSPKYSRIVEAIEFVASLLTPRYFWKEKEEDSEKELKASNRIAYLHGIRGVASLIVAIDHLVVMFHPSLFFGYGQGIARQRWFFQLPFIRVLYSGSAMVAVFFVLSGYVLSYRPVKLLRQGDFEGLQKSLSSSIFNRGFRLFLPTLAATFLMMVGTQLGFYNSKIREHALQAMLNRTQSGYLTFATPAQLPVLQQIWDWVSEMSSFLDPWTWTTFIKDFPYGTHLWAIPVEFRSSMVLFLTIGGTSALRLYPRMYFILSLICYCLFSGRWDIFLYLVGFLMVEIQAEFNSGNEQDILGAYHRSGKRWKQNLVKLCWIFTFAVGMYLASQPEIDAARTPGFQNLRKLVPHSYPEYDAFRFWYAIGAILLVGSISKVEVLQRPFTTAFAQYFGDVSFSLYLFHNPVMNSLGYWILPKMWDVTGSEGLQYELGYFLGMCIVVPVLLWVVDLFNRIVERPLQKATRSLQVMCS